LSTNDGSSSGSLLSAGAGVGSEDEDDADLPWGPALLSPPPCEQETNSTMMPSRAAPSTTARRRQ